VVSCLPAAALREGGCLPARRSLARRWVPACPP